MQYVFIALMTALKRSFQESIVLSLYTKKQNSICQLAWTIVKSTLYHNSHSRTNSIRQQSDCNRLFINVFDSTVSFTDLNEGIVMIILESFCPLLKRAPVFEAAGAVAKIGSGLKSNHQRQIQLAQIGETQCVNCFFHSITMVMTEVFKSITMTAKLGLTTTQYLQQQPGWSPFYFSKVQMTLENDHLTSTATIWFMMEIVEHRFVPVANPENSPLW